MVGISTINAKGFDVGQLPSIPQVLLRLIEACHKVDVSFEELAEIIQKDAALSARIIAVANSAAYAQWNEIKDFNRLLVVLGLNTIKTIAITSVVHQFFSRFNPEFGRWMGRFWRGSLSCAYSAKSLARLTGYESLDEAYLAGLLHKIGQLVFVKKNPAEYPEILLNTEFEKELITREQELFGVTCAEVGAFLISEWDPDSFISDAVLYQYETAEAVLDSPRLVKLVNIAHKMSEYCLSSDELYAQADLLFGLTEPVIDDLQQEVRASVTQAAEGLGIQLDQTDQEGYEFYTDSEEVRLELAKKVREFALLDGVQQHLNATDQLEDTLEAMFQGLKILFGLSRSICFLFAEEGDYLQAVAASRGERDRIGEFRIPFKSGRSLVAQALVEGSVLSSFESIPAPLSSVVDGQISRLLESDGMLCVPLYRKGRDIGVVVAGVNARASRELIDQKGLLSNFAGVASNALYHRQLQIQDRKEVLEQERERQHGKVIRLAHEANNPLAILKNYLQVLSLRLGEDREIQDQLAVLNEEIERVANIVLRMRDVTSNGDPSRGTVDLNELIQGLLGIFRLSHFNSQGISAQLSLDPALPLIVTNRNSIKQILTNLLKNAVEALPQGGVVSLTTRDQINLDGRQYVELKIADNGPGIPGDVMSNIFRPVKTTKGRHHSGLGLAIVKNLLYELGGSISCRNKKKGGAEFVILLPRELEKPQ